jgi:hypothetical protein
MTESSLAHRRLSLVEVLDRVIDQGAVVGADALIGLADVDLIRIALRLVVVPADRGPAPAPPTSASLRAEPVPSPAPGREGHGRRPTPLPPVRASRPTPADRPGLERGLAQLVLTVVELLRELMERQAVRRAMRGGLTDEEEERLGLALMELDQRMDDLAACFRLERADLNLDLGPLGDLL